MAKWIPDEQLHNLAEEIEYRFHVVMTFLVRSGMFWGQNGLAPDNVGLDGPKEPNVFDEYLASIIGSGGTYEQNDGVEYSFQFGRANATDHVDLVLFFKADALKPISQEAITMAWAKGAATMMQLIIAEPFDDIVYEFIGDSPDGSDVLYEGHPDGGFLSVMNNLYFNARLVGSNRAEYEELAG